MLCNSYLVKLLAKVFHHIFNHRFFNCASMAFRWFFVKFALLKWIWALLNCLSPRSLNTLWSLRMTLATLFGRLTPSLLRLSRAVLWYLSLTSTFRLHQRSSLHLWAVFHNKIYDLQTREPFVFQVCVLRYIQVKFAFLAIVFYASYHLRWFMLSIRNLY